MARFMINDCLWKVFVSVFAIPLMINHCHQLEHFSLDWTVIG